MLSNGRDRVSWTALAMSNAAATPHATMHPNWNVADIRRLRSSRSDTARALSLGEADLRSANGIGEAISPGPLIEAAFRMASTSKRP